MPTRPDLFIHSTYQVIKSFLQQNTYQPLYQDLLLTCKRTSDPFFSTDTTLSQENLQVFQLLEPFPYNNTHYKTSIEHLILQAHQYKNHHIVQHLVQNYPTNQIPYPPHHDAHYPVIRKIISRTIKHFMARLIQLQKQSRIIHTNWIFWRLPEELQRKTLTYL